jgi:hypothetical protein
MSEKDSILIVIISQSIIVWTSIAHRATPVQSLRIAEDAIKELNAFPIMDCLISAISMG